VRYRVGRQVGADRGWRSAQRLSANFGAGALDAGRRGSHSRTVAAIRVQLVVAAVTILWSVGARAQAGDERPVDVALELSVATSVEADGRNPYARTLWYFPFELGVAFRAGHIGIGLSGAFGPIWGVTTSGTVVEVLAHGEIVWQHGRWRGGVALGTGYERTTFSCIDECSSMGNVDTRFDAFVLEPALTASIAFDEALAWSLGARLGPRLKVITGGGEAIESYRDVANPQFGGVFTLAVAHAW